MEKKRDGWTPALVVVSIFPVLGSLLYVAFIGHVIPMTGDEALLSMQTTILGGIVLASAGIFITPLKRWYLYPVLLIISFDYIWSTYMGWGNDTANAIVLLVAVFLNILYLRVFYEFEKRDTPAAPTTT